MQKRVEFFTSLISRIELFEFFFHVKMLRFQSSFRRWLALLVLIIFTFEKTCAFSLSNRARNAVNNEPFKFQPTPNLGKFQRTFFLFFCIESKSQVFIDSFKLINSIIFLLFSRTKLPRLCAVNTNFYKKCDPCPHGVQCVPTIQCPAHVRMRAHEKPQICDLPHGSAHGLCCTTGRNFTNHRKFLLCKECDFVRFLPLNIAVDFSPFKIDSFDCICITQWISIRNHSHKAEVQQLMLPQILSRYHSIHDKIS